MIAEVHAAQIMRTKVAAFPIHKDLSTLSGEVVAQVLKSLLVSLNIPHLPHLHVAQLARISAALHHSVSRGKLEMHTQNREKKAAAHLRTRISTKRARQKARRCRLEEKAQQMGKDLGAEIECAVKTLVSSKPVALALLLTQLKFGVQRKQRGPTLLSGFAHG